MSEKTAIQKSLDQMDFTPLEARFCEEYLQSWDARESYKKVYGVDDLMKAKGLLSRKHVKEHITHRKLELCEELGIDTTRVMTELAASAFTDITDLVEYSMEPGMEYLELKPKDQLTKAQRKAIKKITIKKTPGRYGTRVEMGIEVHDKLRAMEALMKHLGLTDTGLQINLQVNNNTVAIDPNELSDAELIALNNRVNG